MDIPGGKSAKAMGSGDRISGLPDELLHHVMSFLPARDTVRTCVLSLRWRNLWESARCLNIDAEGFASVKDFIMFADALLLSRGCTPLDSLFLRANGPSIFLDNFNNISNLWIRHALRSNVQTLGIIDHDQNDAYKEEEDGPLTFHLVHYHFTSSCLKRLHLCYVHIDNRFLTKLFSGCPALEDLEMVNCLIDAIEFSSATLKNLSIDYIHCPFAEELFEYHDIIINMPSLVSLHIGAVHYAKLILVEVHSLVIASVSFGHHFDPVTFDDACNIVGALSNVKNLELLFPYDVDRGYPCILQSDMLLCQVVFTNLTTLSLSGWCLRGDCKALLCLLERSPNLEELTLKLRKYDVYNHLDWFPCAAAEIDPPCQEKAKPFYCEKLRKIEIFCPKGDKRVGMVVAILYANIISPAEINIKPFSG